MRCAGQCICEGRQKAVPTRYCLWDVNETILRLVQTGSKDSVGASPLFCWAEGI